MRIAALTNNSSNIISNTQKSLNKNEDSISQGIRKQIDSIKEQMASLSKNEEMSTETKMSKKKELQAMIDDLNTQLNQRQIEIQSEATKKDVEGVEPKTSNNQTAGNNQTGADKLDVVSMKGLISAGIAMSQVNKSEAIKTNLEGQAGVLTEEIKLDGGRGKDSSLKQNRLSKIKRNISSVSTNTAAKLSDVNEKIKDTKSAVSEKDSEKTGKIDSITREDNTENNSIKTDVSVDISEDKKDITKDIIDNEFISFDPVDIRF